jgi:DNA-directed RNA polymerase specialized sigma24 family protein
MTMFCDKVSDASQNSNQGLDLGKESLSTIDLTTPLGRLIQSYIQQLIGIFAWELEFLSLTDPKMPSGKSIYAYIRQQLTFFHLSGSYTENYILNEVYLRGISKVDKINNLRPWIKGTARLFIKELARKDSKLVFLDEENLSEAPQEEELNWQEHIAALHKALKQLNPIDEKLLNLKIVESKSWAEIRCVMRIEGHGDELEATWRKRKERALLKLRKIYHQLMPPF